MGNEVKVVVTGQNKSRPAMQTALSDVQKITVAVDKIPKAKEIKVTVKDDASKAVDEVNKKKVDDKESKVTAKDDATDTIEKISNTKPKTVTVPVKADFESSDAAWGKMKEAGGAGASAFIGGFTGGLAGGGLIDAASSLITDVFQKAGDKQKLNADVQNMMGITPEAARTYGDRIGHMFWSGIGDSKDQIAGAFGSLSSDVKGWGNLTVDQQDRVVKGAVKISSAFKTDVQEPIRAASSMVSNGLSPSFEAAFDLITGGYQTLGSRADDALDTLTEYAGYFEQLGFTGPAALKLIQDGMQAGARDTDYIADAWKEFGIRIIDGSKLTSDALKDLGLNAKKIPEEISKGGPQAQEAIGKIIDKLQGIKDPIKKNEIGVALFGTQWEDTFSRVIDKTDIAKGKIEDFKGSTDNLATGAITETEKLSRAWDKFTTDFGEDVATYVNHQDEFNNAQNSALENLFGFGEEATNVLDHLGGLGLGIDGVNAKVIGLAEALEGQGANAFGNTILKMSDADLAAIGLKYSMDTLAGRVYTMPDGKPIIINTNTGEVINGLDNVKRRVDNLPKEKFFTYYMDTVVTGPGTGSLNSLTGALRGRNAAGGAVVGHAAEGGPRSGLTMVNERGPELLRQQSGALIDAIGGQTVVPAGQSASIAAAANGGGAGGGWGGGGPIVVQVMLNERQVGLAVVDNIRRQVGAKAGGSVSKFFGGTP